MRLHKRLTKREILKVLREAGHCRLGLCDCNKPYIVPMNFCFRIKDQRLFFRLKSEPWGKKMEMMKHSTNVSLEFEVPTCNGINTVIVQGRILHISKGNDFSEDTTIDIVACTVTGRHKKICNGESFCCE